jgi:hypothetical protein
VAHEIHIGTALAYLLVFESVAFLLPAVILLARWTRYYGGDLRNAWGVTFHSEARLELYGWLITLNGVGLVAFVLWVIKLWMGVTFAW